MQKLDDLFRSVHITETDALKTFLAASSRPIATDREVEAELQMSLALAWRRKAKSRPNGGFS